LSRELADFLIEFSIALHKHAMYPEGHPSLMPAAQGVVNRLNIALLERQTLSLGVARTQLVIEGVATDSKNPVLHDLADRLHRHHLGAVTFRRGVTPDEVHGALSLLSVDADRSGRPLGLSPVEHLTSWPHVRLYPLNYERLDLVREGKLDEEESIEQREERTRAAYLWLGLARAALAAESAADGQEASTMETRGGLGTRPPEEDESATVDPTIVAKAIERHPRGTAYDQVIVGYLLQIAEEVKRGGGADSIALQRRVSQLVKEMDKGTLARLLEMGGDRDQRRQFLLNASDALAVDAVIDLVHAASQTEQQTVSHSFLRMLRKLGQHAAEGSPKRRALADESVREQVSGLIAGWTLKDPNPGAYRAALERMVSTKVPALAERGATRQIAEPHRLLQMAVEVQSGGPIVDRAVQSLIETDRLGVIAKTLAGVEGGGGDLAENIWRTAASPDVVRRVVSTEPINVEQLDVLIQRLGIAAADPMLDALTASQSVQTRRILLDRLVKLGAAVGGIVVARLNDASWFVQRNMLAILAELPERPAGFDPRPFAEHNDARVRREAIRVMLRDAAFRDRAIHFALKDDDPRTVRAGLAAALETGCPDSVVPLAASLAASGATDLRLMAIRLLGTSRNPAAADALLTIALPPRKSLISRMRTTKAPEQRAAVTALRAFADNPRVKRALEQLGEG
jgi:hypothetical protein